MEQERERETERERDRERERCASMHLLDKACFFSADIEGCGTLSQCTKSFTVSFQPCWFVLFCSFLFL